MIFSCYISLQKIAVYLLHLGLVLFWSNVSLGFFLKSLKAMAYWFILLLWQNCFYLQSVFLIYWLCFLLGTEFKMVTWNQNIIKVCWNPHKCIWLITMQMPLITFYLEQKHKTSYSKKKKYCIQNTSRISSDLLIKRVADFVPSSTYYYRTPGCEVCSAVKNSFWLVQ